MTQHQNYYQDVPNHYEEYYSENNDLEQTSQEFPQDLDVPNTNLYTDHYPDVTELYARNSPFAESQQHVETTNGTYRSEYNPGPHDYFYESRSSAHPHHRSQVPKSHSPYTQNPSNYHYVHHQAYPYSTCPLATTQSLEEPPLQQCVSSRQGMTSQMGASPFPGMRSWQQMSSQMEHSSLQGVNCQKVMASYQGRNLRRGMSSLQEGHVEGMSSNGYQLGDYNQTEYSNRVLVDQKGRRVNLGGSKVRNGVRKYPVTVKMPRFVATKKLVAMPLNKRPSALCLPVVTQPDPALSRKLSRSKTHHHIRRSDISESHQNGAVDAKHFIQSVSAHQMHSQGDVNEKQVVTGLETLLDEYENEVALNDMNNMLNTEEIFTRNSDDVPKNNVQEFAKFLKPKVPSSIKEKQAKISKMTSLNKGERSIQPKMKRSLDKLLNRLQKCENNKSEDTLSEEDYNVKVQADDENKMKKTNLESFNYETITKKLSSSPKVSQDSPDHLLNKPSTSVATSLDHKKSLKTMPRALDDQCALDLHKSKSYIVDLIDRALSKELGTVPREKMVDHGMNPKKAVETISRHCFNKGLCYEVTTALTDSIISTATAPKKEKDEPIEEDTEVKNKICTCNIGNTSYISQLKQLRWGHIRHIQHEARKLADLEEFLEKCGEIDL